MKLKAEKAKENMDKNEAEKISDDKVIDLLFKQVEKPKNYFKLKVINVFGYNYRINIWSNTEEEGLTKCKISSSYFVRVVDDILTIYHQ